MSRWSRRSEAEKKEILERQRQQQENAKQFTKTVLDGGSKAIAGDYDKKLHDQEAIKAITDKMELPLFCLKDGWVGSNKYRLTDKIMFGNSYTTLSGNCRICNQPLSKAIMGDEQYLMLVVALSPELVRQDRFKDERQKKE